jgi:hypothetical protein
MKYFRVNLCIEKKIIITSPKVEIHIFYLRNHKHFSSFSILNEKKKKKIQNHNKSQQKNKMRLVEKSKKKGVQFTLLV